MKSSFSVTALLLPRHQPPEQAQQFHGALTADTQQSKLQEESNGDGRPRKSETGKTPTARVEGVWVLSGLPPAQEKCWGAGVRGKCLEAGDMLAMLRDHKGRVKWELKHKSRTTPPFQSKQAVRGTADSRQRGSWHALVCSRWRVGRGPVCTSVQ